MGLGQLTSRAAVLEALAICDQLGREAFLHTYGFQPARRYHLLHEGRQYDSKAIVGVAHGVQFPELGPLHPSDFSGGEATVASKLRTLGFAVYLGSPAPRQPTTSGPATTAMSWDIEVGASLPRSQLQARYGGTRYGGIAPCRSSPNVLLFTDPAKGPQHGYYDGWVGDCFHYTGEGQHGDQQFRAGNKAIRDHHRTERTLRLFRADSPQVTYLGAFVTDPEKPYYITDAPETDDGPLRSVIVFRLRPDGPVLHRDQERMRTPTEQLASLARIRHDGHPSSTLHTQQDQPSNGGMDGPSRLIELPPEVQHLERYQLRPGGSTKAERREAGLATRYRRYLQQQGHEVVRFAIPPGQELKPLLYDLFDKTTWELIEAKSTATRDAIRYGLGQLLDYRRFIQPIPAMALLVPSQPREDLRTLLAEHSIRVIWEDPSGQFCHADI